MVCEICGKQGARIRRISRTYGRGKNLLVIQGVPVVHCPHCQESYMTAQTLREIERIRRHKRTSSVERPVRVAAFAQ